MTFISGGYTATLGGSSLGQIQAGFTIDHQIFKRLITGDNYADTVQDGINRGMGVHISMTLLEYNAAAAATALWPYGSTYLTFSEKVGQIDVQQSKVDSLILTAVAGPPAATVPATITCLKTILAENHNVSMLFAPDLRTIPLRMRVYPVAGVFGTLT